jgi:ATP-dependent helicase/nuclease subunit B
MPVILRYQTASPAPTPAERIARGAFATFLIVVPTKRRTRHLARELVSRMPGGAGPHPHLYTLETLATALFRVLKPDAKFVKGVTQTLLFRQAVFRSGPGFRYFTLRKGAFPLQRGTFDTITGVIAHLKESGITPEMLATELDLAEPDEVHKLSDVIDIYRAYDSGLLASSQTDVGGMFRTLAAESPEREFAGAFRTLFPLVDIVAVGGFDEFSEPELGLLRKIRAVSGLAIDLTFDFHPGNPELFGHLEENYRRFRELGLHKPPRTEVADWPDLILGREMTTSAAGSPRERLSERMFNSDQRKGKVSLADRVTLVHARDREEEAELVCRMIKRMIQTDPDLDLSRICVAMHIPSAYSSIFRRMFARYGVAANITDRHNLARSPLVVSLFALLQVGARDFRRDDILRIADSPYLTLTTEPAGGGHALADVSGRLKIIGGYASWLARIDAALQQSGGTPSQTGNRQSIPGEDATRLRLQAARRLIENLHANLGPFAGALTPSAFEREVRLLLDRLQVRNPMFSPGTENDAAGRERDVRAFARFLEVLSEMTAALSSTGERDATHPLPFYLETLNVALASERYNVREQFGRGVLVTAIEETRGLSMEVMFLVGLVDGEFPSVYQPEVFYSLARQKLRARRHTWEQRYLFYQAVTNWTRQLVLTYPEQEREIELVRSSFVDALLEVTDVPDRRADELMAPEELLSESGLLKYMAGATGVHPGVPEGVTPRTRETIEAVQRAAKVELSRMETHALPGYEGVIGQAVTETGHRTLRALREKVFSVSQLESYGACPFQFFGTRVLRLRPLEDFREDLSPMEKGSLIHEILCRFMSDRKSRGLPDLWRCTVEESGSAEGDLLEIARTLLDGVNLPDPFWEAERDSLLGAGDRPGLLQNFLRRERERATPLHARFFEVAFGPRMTAHGMYDPELSSDEPVMVGPVKLRGRVDRVETGEHVFSIIDYKTGKGRTGLDDIREGTSLQLPLYLRAIQILLEARLDGKFIPGAGLHYHLTDEVALSPVLASEQQRGLAFGDQSRSHQIVPTDEDLRLLIDSAVARAGEFVQAMSSGIFPLTTPDRIARVCRICPMKTVCRVQSAYHVPREQEDVS